MKNAEQVLGQPDQPLYCSAIQLALPLNINISLDSDDPVFAFLEAVKEIDFNKYVRAIRSNNTKSHDRGMLLKTMLFGYMNGETSLSRLSELCRTDLRYMFLSEEEKPSKMAFSRLTEDLKESIDDIFFDLTSLLCDRMGINQNEVQYIDGTKIEANAHKNTFVYKKRIINARKRLYSAITESITSLNGEYGWNYPTGKEYCSQEIGYIVQYLMEVMVHENTELQYGKGHRKSKFQEFYDLFLKYALKLDEYEYWLSVIEDRNSCSKTDHDATFMATKWDYYNQSGITRPCYNCQISVSDGVIVNGNVYQSPGDTVTWIPFMERYHDHTGSYPKNPVADAGYGSYDNYLYDLQCGMNLVQKYPMYGKEHDKKYARRVYDPFNWPVNEEGYKVCPAGRIFSVAGKDKYSETRNGNLSISQTFTEPRKCSRCGKKKECLNRWNKSGFKTLSRNAVMAELQEEAKRQLGTKEGTEMKIQRAIQVEGAFGVIKQDFGFTRFHRKSLKSTKMEFLLVCLGYDLRKYYLFWLKAGQNNTLKLLS